MVNNPPAWRFTCHSLLALTARCLIFAVLATGLVAASVHAEDEVDPRWNIKGWTPGLTLTLGTFATEMYGFVESRDSNFDPLPGRPADDSQKTFVVPMLHVGLTVDSPPLPRIPGNIRIFGSVDYFATFPPERFAANEASPSGFFITEDAIDDVPEEAIEGQGSHLQMKTNRNAYGATLGFVVPLELMGVKFALRPGASWMRYKWEMSGVILEAIKVEAVESVVVGRAFRGVDLAARGKIYSNGFGPYLGLEIEPMRIGPAYVGVFAEGAYYRVVGDRNANITMNATFIDSVQNIPNPETYQGRWGANLSRSFWRAGVGLRIYLAGKR